jgi:hypothetical protein
MRLVLRGATRLPESRDKGCPAHAISHPLRSQKSKNFRGFPAMLWDGLKSGFCRFVSDRPLVQIRLWAPAFQVLAGRAWRFTGRSVVFGQNPGQHSTGLASHEIGADTAPASARRKHSAVTSDSFAHALATAGRQDSWRAIRRAAVTANQAARLSFASSPSRSRRKAVTAASSGVMPWIFSSR